MSSLQAVAEDYDRVAEEYARRVGSELKDKPFDRELLDRFAEAIGPSGVICDMGCGPGHVAKYLRERGIHVCGRDISPKMVTVARRLNPEIEFCVDNMLCIHAGDCTWDGIVAFYSLICIPRVQQVEALRELARVVRPNGHVLLAFHCSAIQATEDAWQDAAISVDYITVSREETKGYCEEAGLLVAESVEREPYRGFELNTRRAYMWTRRRAG